MISGKAHYLVKWRGTTPLKTHGNS
jgi:hypothetical protein